MYKVNFNKYDVGGGLDSLTGAFLVALKRGAPSRAQLLVLLRY